MILRAKLERLQRRKELNRDLKHWDVMRRTMKVEIYRFMSRCSCYPRHNKNLNVSRYVPLQRHFPRLVTLDSLTQPLKKLTFIAGS
jgi:hypothetical protein